MKSATHKAFTLLELLIVIGIVATLAAVVLPVYGTIQRTAQRTQSMNNLRQLGTALVAYAGDNNGSLPTEGVAAPNWAANTAAEATAWYNVLPQKYGNSKGLSDYNNSRADFYSKNSLFYVPAAKYPSTKLNAPLFAIALCSKLYGTVGGITIDPEMVRVGNFQAAAQTCIFQESGLLGEAKIRASQSAYNGQSKSFASRSVARYGNKTILVFADGHADLTPGTDIVDPSGKAYYPQIGQQVGQGGTVSWTMNPALNANQ